MKKLIICIGLTLVLSACASDHIVRYNFSEQENINTDVTPTYEGKTHFFLWGKWQEKNYNIAEMCKEKGVSRIENHWTFYDTLLGSLSMGIYTPESYSIYCNE